MLSPAGSSEESHDIKAALGFRLDYFHVFMEPQHGVERYPQDPWVRFDRERRAIHGHDGCSSHLLGLHGEKCNRGFLGRYL